MLGSTFQGTQRDATVVHCIGRRRQQNEPRYADPPARRRGYEVLVAEDGAAAIEVARASRPDLVLMDMSLPVLDGWEATRRLKADPQTATIPIIALTAHAMADDRTKALDAGCDDYDTKPIEFELLLVKMNRFLNAGQLRDGLIALPFHSSPG